MLVNRCLLHGETNIFLQKNVKFCDNFIIYQQLRFLIPLGKRKKPRTATLDCPITQYAAFFTTFSRREMEWIAIASIPLIGKC
jgi:hypothetical protein